MTSVPETAPSESATEPAAPVVTNDRTNTLAIAAFALSLSGFTIIAQIAGIITGHMALKQLKTSGERGHALAKWGLIISYVVVGLWVLLFVFFIAMWGIMMMSLIPLFGAMDPYSMDMMQYSDSF